MDEKFLSSGLEQDLGPAETGRFRPDPDRALIPGKLQNGKRQPTKNISSAILHRSMIRRIAIVITDKAAPAFDGQLHGIIRIRDQSSVLVDDTDPDLGNTAHNPRSLHRQPDSRRLARRLNLFFTDHAPTLAAQGPQNAGSIGNIPAEMKVSRGCVDLG